MPLLSQTAQYHFQIWGWIKLRSDISTWSAENYPPLEQEFYLQNTIEAAKQLLDCILIYRSPQGVTAGRISETEAYLHNDPASHAFRGMTRRNAAMFEAPGRAYIYFTYGMHYCLNAVTAPREVGEAVLIRAVEPLFGWELMVDRRSLSGWNIEDITTASTQEDIQKRLKFARLLSGGPAKLCQAFGLSSEQNGIDLTNGNTLWISKPSVSITKEVLSSKRIGITKGVENPWRFTLSGDAYTSR